MLEEDIFLLDSIKFSSGSIYTLRTMDTVAAVSWGVSPCWWAPCCLGKRQVGAKLLPAGFQFGRHLFLIEHRRDQVNQEEAQIPNIQFKPMVHHSASISTTCSSIINENTEIVVQCYQPLQPSQPTSDIILGTERTFSFVFPRRTRTGLELGNVSGCLELKNNELVPGIYIDQQPKLTQQFRLIPVIDKNPDRRAWFPSNQNPDQIASHQNLFTIEPVAAPGKRLQAAVGSFGGAITTVKVASRSHQDRYRRKVPKQQVFLLHPRATYLVTDFIIEPFGPFCQRLSDSFASFETDYRNSVVVVHSGMDEKPSVRVSASGKLEPNYPNHTTTEVKHDFNSSEIAHTVSLAMLVIQIITSTGTIATSIGVGDSSESSLGVGLRITLYLYLLVTYVGLWLVHNQYYNQRLYHFLLRRGFLMEFTEDMTTAKQLVFQGWIWYWIGITIYFIIGAIYLGYLQHASIGTLWIFFSNSVVYLFGIVYRFRSSFNAQLIPLNTFVKSFGNGVITETAIQRAGEYLKTLQSVQACVPIANPPTYTYLGKLPSSLQCCWGCGSYTRHSVILFVLFGFFGAIILTLALLTKVVF